MVESPALSCPSFRTPSPLNPGAPLFIYLPGGDGTGELFYRQLEGLEKVFDIRCLTIPPDDLTSWDKLAEQVVDLVRTELDQSNQQRVYLCGESFGGCLALKVITRAPELFHHLILVNPATSFRRRSLLCWATQLLHPAPEFLYRLVCLGLLPFLASLNRIEEDDRIALLKALQAMTQESALWRVALLREFHMSSAELNQIMQPTLVIASQGDAILPSRTEAEWLIRQLPNAKMHLLTQSGHACLLETDIHLYFILKSAEFV